MVNNYEASSITSTSDLIDFFIHVRNVFPLTLFRIGGSKKTPPYQLFPCYFVRISFENLLTFSFNPFGRLVLHFKFIPSTSPKLLNLNEDHPSEKAVFLVKS